MGTALSQKIKSKIGAWVILCYYKGMPANQFHKIISKTEWFVFLIIIGTTFLSFTAAETGARTNDLLRVYFINVGQGDAQLINFDGKQVLIDGGPDNKVLSELGRIMPFNDRTIDLVILTHPDADHINGLIKVLDRYEVTTVLENFLENHDSPAYREWNKIKTKSAVTQAANGQIIDIGNGAYIKVLFPIAGSAQQSKTNNNSIILMLVYGGNELLFTGDTEAKVERELIGRGIDIDADFLKIAHHGSKTSTADEFLDAVTPEAAFIQLGKDNRYGHPHPTVLERLDSRGIKYYRTDTNGLIELVLDGRNYRVRTDE